MAGLYLAWATFRVSQHNADQHVDLLQVADNLAYAVGKQWQDEARLRRINDPYPLPVSWRPAPEDLVESWPIVTLAAESWPGGPPNLTAGWAQKPDELAAHWAQIFEVFSRKVPTRRLIVLGEPGSGKSMLLVRLAQSLVADRSNGTDRSVPVIFSLASWNPNRVSLYTWLAESIARTYHSLDRDIPGGNVRVSYARALIDHHFILPILDGFDELPTHLRPAALDAINQELPPGQGLVLSSRTDEYRDAALSNNDIPMKLAGAAGIELQPIDAKTAKEYLLRDAGGGSTASRRWKLVVDQLGTASPIGLALRTPLMLFLARTIYNPRPGERSGAPLQEPATLCSNTELNSQGAVERYLLTRFVPAAYRAVPESPVLWTAAEAERSLVFLARHLEFNMAGTPDLAWWQITRALPLRPVTVAIWAIVIAGFATPITCLAGLFSGVAYGLASWFIYDSWSEMQFGIVLGAVGGATWGVLFGVTASMVGVIRGVESKRTLAWMHDVPPLMKVGWVWNGRAALLSLMAGVAVGAVGGLLLHSKVGTYVGILVSIGSIIWAGLRAMPANVTEVTSPAVLLKHERRLTRIVALTASSLVGIVSAIILAIVGPLKGGLSTAAMDGVVIGVVSGISIGLIGRLYRSMWLSFAAARWYLAYRHDLPRDLIDFLADAHQRRGVLRQVGGHVSVSAP